MNKDVCRLMDQWAEVTLQQDLVRSWDIGAIFPREMCWFLAVCEYLSVKVIIESGRQDGYSTQYLGLYTDKTNSVAYSIDIEKDEQAAAQCRQRLTRFPNLSLINGNAFYMLGPLVIANLSSPTAVLVDGPKGYEAMSLVFAAAAFPSVSVAGMHNLDTQLEEHGYFRSRGHEPVFYEDIQLEIGEHWSRLEREERELYQRLNPMRDFEKSSLGLFHFAENAHRFQYLRPAFRLGAKQPGWQYLKWRLFQRL